MAAANQTKFPAWCNVPNQLSIARLILALVLFVFLSFDFFLTSMVIFILAATTDYVDGFWARRYGQVTRLGRILDPFADKTVVCGAFIFLAAVPESPVAAWMAVIVVVRELLVTALRSFLEEAGGDFSAKWSGKWKMAAQCLAIALCLWWLGHAAAAGAGPTSTRSSWLFYLVHGSIWIAIGLTFYSGIMYILAAQRMFRRIQNKNKDVP
ncbi:MAG: CDP-diacylglycerol--glycerol-3-phosphate 3-phosphatidyltransferase [Pirellulales bacterium]|nr:CDP-diacylglycerol--glycerol-3-phosphate 3-phosphatidyltransferase [Pirellulales bacterium]